MLRRLLLYLSEAGWMRALVTHFWLARRVALRFVAGETMEQALAVTRDLNAQGLLVTLDLLGESVHSEADTHKVAATYSDIIKRIRTDNLNASVSLKLTHMGLDISEDLCMANLRNLLSEARDSGIPVTLDMEGSKYTDVTLRIFRTLLHEYNFNNVGTVIQAALRRSSADMRQLATEGARIRLCKGAYLEPPEIAFPDKADVDRHYVEIMDAYLQAPPPAKLEIATHDENMIRAAQNFITQYSVPKARYEFQMLYGIRSSRQIELANAGEAVRVYVPFGDAWYPYFMRRLAERPANLWFFVKSLFSR